MTKLSFSQNALTKLGGISRLDTLRSRSRQSRRQTPVSVSDFNNTSSSLNDLLTQMRSRTVPHVLPFTTDGKIKMVNPKEIVYLRSDDHYVHVQLVSESFYQRKSLKQMEDLLDSTQFIRIHRSTIINTDFLKELESLTHGDYSVLMKDGSKHTLSRRYSDRLGL